MHRLLACSSLFLVARAIQAGTPPTGEQLLATYDALMGPESFDSISQVIAHRDDGTSRTYRIRVLKAGNDDLRVWFQEPASVRGQEMLRQGENLWVYLPSLKRAVRMASRESFQGGDFNNADILRVNYKADYTPVIAKEDPVPDAWLLELKAKTANAAYDRIRIWMDKSELMPLKGEYYGASGTVLRSAEFTDVRTFKGVRRPSRIVMHNMLATNRYSVMLIDSMTVNVSPSPSRFVLDALGR